MNKFHDDEKIHRIAAVVAVAAFGELRNEIIQEKIIRKQFFIPASSCYPAEKEESLIPSHFSGH